jgi:hypothetical protein
MNERNEQTVNADQQTIRARADLRYLGRISPSTPKRRCKKRITSAEDVAFERSRSETEGGVE